MRIAGILFVWLCLAGVLLTGCPPARPYPPLVAPVSARLVEVGSSPAGAAPALTPVSYAPRNVLVLSGGGMNGAYTAGVLRGWTASGKRPVFDVVTGISTGALIAPFALLGPEYDDVLERAYTTASDRDIFSKRSLLALPLADSLADSTPLRRRIEEQITPEVLARVAEAHTRGRRLYVGTTDLDTRRLVVWDLGAVAAGSDPDKLSLFRRVLLASASVPGLLPPVPINVEVDGRRFSELHVDGGVTASLFLRPEMLPRPAGQSGSDDTSVYVIVAGKLRPTPRAVKRQLVQVAEDTIGGLLQSQFEGDLLRIYLLSRSRGARFALAAIPQEFPDGPASLSFDPRVMRALYDEGRRSAQAGTAWRPTPPGLTRDERLRPRTGVRFRLEK